MRLLAMCEMMISDAIVRNQEVFSTSNPCDLVYLLVYDKPMIKLNVHEAKTHLSRYLELVEKGESITLCKRNVPIAEIRPIRKPKAGKRPIGTGKGDFHLDERFFEPLPDDLLELFNGGGE